MQLESKETPGAYRSSRDSTACLVPRTRRMDRGGVGLGGVE